MQMVYNEWGALIKHQDEMAMAFQAQDMIRRKNFQKQYNDDLQKQKDEHQQ